MASVSEKILKRYEAEEDIEITNSKKKEYLKFIDWYFEDQKNILERAFKTEEIYYKIHSRIRKKEGLPLSKYDTNRMIHYAVDVLKIYSYITGKIPVNGKGSNYKNSLETIETKVDSYEKLPLLRDRGSFTETNNEEIFFIIQRYRQLNKRQLNNNKIATLPDSNKRFPLYRDIVDKIGRYKKIKKRFKENLETENGVRDLSYQQDINNPKHRLRDFN